MEKHPFDNGFVLPLQKCTNERKLFFHRMNEILSFLYVTTVSLNDCNNNYQKLIPKMPYKEDTPIKITLSGGNFATMPAKRLIKLTREGVDILTRQIFIMIYGSFETYLYQLFEKSYSKIGITEKFLDKSIDILMRKKWDGKFCKMSEEFELGYKANSLITHFSGFKLNFEGESFNNPLTFLDELAKIRHKIIHASSIYEKDTKIFIEVKVFNEMFGFFSMLTDYIDKLFSQRFEYERIDLKPADA